MSRILVTGSADGLGRLATSDDPEALTTGGYWYHQERQEPHVAVHDAAFQDRLLQALAQETGNPL